MSAPNSPHWITDLARRQFETDGYMAIPNVVPVHWVEAAVGEITAFVGADLGDSRTWYGGAPELDSIVPLHHAQSLWDIRQNPNLYEVFAEYFANPRLMVDMNRCIFRPPVHPSYPTMSHGSIHWDMDPRTPGPGLLQGVVLLTDTGRNEGGFQCIPEIYRALDGWLGEHATGADFDFFNPGLNGWESTQVEGKAGDVILWSTKLPHGTASNLSSRPRIAAFVSMQPATAWASALAPRVSDTAQLQELMKAWWSAKRAPDFWRGLPGQLDPEPGPPAVLSELGMKLVGILPW